MSTKKPSLSAALREAASRTATEPASAETPPSSAASHKRPSRHGLKVISGHFDPAVSKQLRLLALERDSNVQALLAEAINDLFAKHGKSPIA
jgi:hypothetical protein